MMARHAARAAGVRDGDAAHTNHAVGDDDLRRLALSRAQAVEEHLVDHGVLTERIFPVPSKTLVLPARDQAPAARAYLSIRN
jgi:hypothetical protein